MNTLSKIFNAVLKSYSLLLMSIFVYSIFAWILFASVIAFFDKEHFWQALGALTLVFFPLACIIGFLVICFLILLFITECILRLVNPKLGFNLPIEKLSRPFLIAYKIYFSFTFILIFLILLIPFAFV